MKPMNILFLTKGMARYRKNLIDGFAEHLPDIIDVSVSTPSPKESLWEVDWGKLTEEGVRPRFREFPVVDFLSFVSSIFRPKNPQPSIGAERIEDMDLHMAFIQEFSLPMLKVALFCKLSGIPCIVCTDMGMNSNWGTQFSKAIRFQHKCLSWLTDGIVAHAPAAEAPLAAHWRPMCFVPHTVDTRTLGRTNPSTKDPRNPVRLLMVASFTPTKGHDLLIAAVEKLVEKKIINFKIRLIGTNDSGEVKKLVDEKSLTPYFDFPGTLTGEPLYEEFREADAFVLSSRGDTFGVVVHEAAVFGLPLVISKFAGASSVLVEEGRNGFVIDPYDTEIFSEKLEQLILQPDMRREFSEHSQQIGEKFCAGKLGKKLANWTMSFLSGNHP